MQKDKLMTFLMKGDSAIRGCSSYMKEVKVFILLNSERNTGLSAQYNLQSAGTE